MANQSNPQYAPSFYNPYAANAAAGSQPPAHNWQTSAASAYPRQQQPPPPHARQVSEPFSPNSMPTPDSNGSHAPADTSSGFQYRDGSAAGAEFSPSPTAAGFKPYRSETSRAQQYYAVQQQQQQQQQRQQQQQIYSTASILAKQYDEYFEACIRANPQQADYFRQQKLEYRKYFAQLDPYIEWADDSDAAEPEGRCTPLKFSQPHVRLSLSCPGLAVQVPPARPDEGEPARVHLFDSACLTADWDRADFSAYPGPLMPGDTLKSEVRAFLNAKLVEMHERLADADWEDAALLIGFLDFLVRNNGIAMGSDLSDLLLEGHEPRTAHYRAFNASSGLDASAADVAMDAFASLPPSEPASGRTSPTAHQQQQQQHPELAAAAAAALSSREDAEAEAEKRLDRFRKLLMYGRKREALEYASRRGLWGQALFLAHQMDPGLHGRMLDRFAARAMQPGDPLIALYQFMQGREPELTDLRQWRPFLAMLLANRADRPRLAAAAVARLGDRLLSAGRLYASQLCHLLAGGCVALDNDPTGAADSGWGDATDADRREASVAESLDPFRPGGPVLLVGFDRAAATAVPNEAVQLTEVFEFAVGLRDRRRRFENACQRRLSARLLPYKFLYATRLLDAGLSEEAFRYCREVGRGLLALGDEFDGANRHDALMRETLRLAERLRCHPAVSEHLDSDWLSELASLAAGRQGQRQQLLDKPAEPAPAAQHSAYWQPPTMPQPSFPSMQQQQQQQSGSSAPAPPAAASSVHVAFDAFDEPVSQIPNYQRRRTLSSSGESAAAGHVAGSGAHSRQTSPAPAASMSPPSSPSASRPAYAPPPQPPLSEQPPPPQQNLPSSMRQAVPRSRESSLSSGRSRAQQQQQSYPQYQHPVPHVDQPSQLQSYSMPASHQPQQQQQYEQDQLLESEGNRDPQMMGYEQSEMSNLYYQYQQRDQENQFQHEQQSGAVQEQNYQQVQEQPLQEQAEQYLRSEQQPQQNAQQLDQSNYNQLQQEYPQSQQQYPELSQHAQGQPHKQYSEPPQQQYPEPPEQAHQECQPTQQQYRPSQLHSQQLQNQAKQQAENQQASQLYRQQQPPQQYPQSQQPPQQYPQSQQPPQQYPQSQQPPQQYPQSQQPPQQHPSQQQPPQQYPPQQYLPQQQPPQQYPLQQKPPQQQPQQQYPSQQQPPQQYPPQQYLPQQQPPQQYPLQQKPPQQQPQQQYPSQQQPPQQYPPQQKPPQQQQPQQYPPQQYPPQQYPPQQYPPQQNMPGQQYQPIQQQVQSPQQQQEQQPPPQPQQAASQGMFSRMFGRMFGSSGDTQPMPPPPPSQQPPGQAPRQQAPPPPMYMQTAQPLPQQQQQQASTAAPGGPPPPPPPQPPHYFASGKSIFSPAPVPQ